MAVTWSWMRVARAAISEAFADERRRQHKPRDVDAVNRWRTRRGLPLIDANGDLVPVRRRV